MATLSDRNEHLAEVDRHIAETEARIATEERRVARLSAAGRDTNLAEGLLAAMRESLAAMCRHRRLILRELASDEPGAHRRGMMRRGGANAPSAVWSLQ